MAKRLASRSGQLVVEDGQLKLIDAGEACCCDTGTDPCCQSLLCLEGTCAPACATLEFSPPPTQGPCGGGFNRACDDLSCIFPEGDIVLACTGTNADNSFLEYQWVKSCDCFGDHLDIRISILVDRIIVEVHHNVTDVWDFTVTPLLVAGLFGEVLFPFGDVDCSTFTDLTLVVPLARTGGEDHFPLSVLRCPTLPTEVSITFSAGSCFSDSFCAYQSGGSFPYTQCIPSCVADDLPCFVGLMNTDDEYPPGLFTDTDPIHACDPDSRCCSRYLEQCVCKCSQMPSLDISLNARVRISGSPVSYTDLSLAFTMDPTHFLDFDGPSDVNNCFWTWENPAPLGVDLIRLTITPTCSLGDFSLGVLAVFSGPTGVVSFPLEVVGACNCGYGDCLAIGSQSVSCSGGCGDPFSPETNVTIDITQRACP